MYMAQNGTVKVKKLHNFCCLEVMLTTIPRQILFNRSQTHPVDRYTVSVFYRVDPAARIHSY